MTASAGGVRAGKAFVEFHADSSPFVRGLRVMDKELKAWGARLRTIGAGLTGVGAAGAAALAPLAANFASTGDRLKGLSDQTGLAVESLQGLEYAASQSNTSLETITGALTSVQDKLVDAAKGSFEAGDGFRAMGLNVAQLAAMRPEQRLGAIADRLAMIQNPAAQAAAAMTVFGESGRELVPLLKGGSRGLDQFMSKAKGLGGVLGGDTVAAAAELSNEFKNVQTATLGLTNQVVAALAPSLIEVSKLVSNAIAKMTAWVSENRAAIVTVAKVAAGIGAAGAVLVTLGTALGVAGSAFGVLATVTAAIVSPIGLMVAGIAAGTAAFLTLTETGQGVLSTLMGKFGELTNFMGDAWKGISALIAAGDFGKAAELAFAALNVAWTSTIASVRGVWDSWVNYFRDSWDTAVTVMAKLMTNAWASIQYAGVQAWDFILDAFDGFRSALLRVGAMIFEQMVKPLQVVAGLVDQVAGTDFKKALGDTAKNGAAGTNLQADQLDQQIYQREQRRKQSLANIEANRQGANQSLDDELVGKIASRMQGQDKAVTAANAAYQKALSEYQTALNEAKQVRADTIAGKTATAAAGPKKQDFQGANFLQTAAKATVQGTFSGAAAGRFSSTGGPDKQVTLLQSIDRSLLYIRDKRATFEN